MMRLTRPRPPRHLSLRYPDAFAPAPEMQAWAQAALIDDAGPVHNPDHGHLADAHLGFLWTNVENARGGRQVVGQAEVLSPRGGKWQVARVEHQLREWFGDVPDFIITLDAVYAAAVDDPTFCALVDHELYHCGQMMRDGEPVFHRDGSPRFAMRGHDAEEFVGVVRRWGVGAAAGGVAALVAAARERPSIARAAIAGACGTCLKVAA